MSEFLKDETKVDFVAHIEWTRGASLSTGLPTAEDAQEVLNDWLTRAANDPLMTQSIVVAKVYRRTKTVSYEEA